MTVKMYGLQDFHSGTTLPVNPLTADIIGNPGHKAPETPRKEYNPGIFGWAEQYE